MSDDDVGVMLDARGAGDDERELGDAIERAYVAEGGGTGIRRIVADTSET